MARDDFSSRTKRKLAERAGYLCSICNVITVGPSNETSYSVNLTGVAAHIAGASEGPGSRRHDPAMLPSQRKDIDNGIWLCALHAQLIDRDALTYTTAYLRSIKKNHEQKIKLQQSGFGIEKGVITKIELSNFGCITTPICLEFSDRNIIYGDNGVGKTLLLEMITSLSKKKYLDRWTHRKGEAVNSFCNLFYFRHQLDKFTISIDHQQKISYAYNNAPIPFLVPAMTIVYLNKSYWKYLYTIPEDERETKSLIELLAMYFDLTTDEFISVVGGIMRDKKFFFNDIHLNKANTDLMVRMHDDIGGTAHSFQDLSTGEQERVILEIALKIVSYHSKFTSTIFLLEHTSFPTIDVSGINRLLDVINKEQLGCQFFFATLQIKGYQTQDYKIYELAKTKNETVEAHLVQNG